MEIVGLDGGARVFLAEEKKFSSCTAAILLGRKLKREEVTENALLVNLMGLGNGKYRSPSELNRAADRLFGGCFDCVNLKKGDRQLLEFYAEAVNEGDNVENAIRFLGELILNPLTEGKGFKAEYAEREKQALRAEISAAKDDKKSYAKNRLIEEMFKGESFGVYGDGYSEDIDRLTPEGLYRHYRDIVDSSDVDIIVAGNFDREKVLEALNRLNLKSVKREPFEKQELKKRKTSYITEKMDVEQGKLCVGIRIQGDYYALLAANEIFGGGANSRLFMKAREKGGLCYYISSGLVRGNGTVIVQSGISSENVKRVNEIIAEEIKGLESADEKEIKSAKESLIKKYTAAEDSLAGISEFCLGTVLWGGAESLNEAKEKIRALKANDIRQAFSGAAADTVYFLKEKGKDS